MTFDSLICQRMSLYTTTQNYFGIKFIRKAYTFYKMGEESRVSYWYSFALAQLLLDINR